MLTAKRVVTFAVCAAVSYVVLLALWSRHIFSLQNANPRQQAAVTCIHDRAPPDRESLGHSTWTLLHTLTTNYAEDPSPELQHNITQFFHLLGALYPCPQCRRHFSEMISEFPPETKNRHTLSTWLSRLHNKVNKRLKKPIFAEDEIDKRWYSPSLGKGAEERELAGNTSSS